MELRFMGSRNAADNPSSRTTGVGPEGFVKVARLADLQAVGCLAVHAAGHTIALFADGDLCHAVDNRCPHMGFPLHRGSLDDGILTCHWHHARFDLASGGTFDPWADDVRTFPVEIRNREIWVDASPLEDPQGRDLQRIRNGLERNISLLIGKGVISSLEGGTPAADSFRAGLEFGVKNRRGGWGQGLTIHTCMMNLLPYLDSEDRPHALYHGLSAVARDTAGAAPRFCLRPLPSSTADQPTLKRWFRQFVEVRDSDGAERCIVSAVRAGADHAQMADMLFAAATDRRYIQTGHVLDFTNKALEALGVAGWKHAETVLASLATAYAEAFRMEESNAWRRPVDLVAILETAFEELPGALKQGEERRGSWEGADALLPVLLGDEAQPIAAALMHALREGAPPPAIAAAVVHASVLRVSRFPVSNEFGDWDTALHTFTFANAVHQGLLRAPCAELVRGVFDAAMSVYLDRQLNVPPARLPDRIEVAPDPEEMLAELSELLDHRQQVDSAGGLVAAFLSAGGDPDRLLAALGASLVREDRDFHTIQMVEAGFRHHRSARGTPGANDSLVAVARYLAAHSATVRAQEQTYRIAQRLHRGEHIWDG